MKKNDSPIIVEQTFEASKDKVWGAITELDEMVKWYFENIPDFKPKIGFTTQFNVISEGRNFLHKWKVTKILPLEQIVYNWQYEQYKGSADIEFNLSEIENFTKLQIKVIVLEDFPEDIPEFKRESCIAGWEYFIQGRLKEFLNMGETSKE